LRSIKVKRDIIMSEVKKCCCGGGDTTSGEDIRTVVKEKYGQVAVNASERKETSCCGSGTSKDAITRDLYSEAETEGIPVEALLASMGCANPLALAQLNPGEVVLDLGSGGGIDVLLSAKRVGPTGKAYGLDMTDEMLNLARKNQAESGLENVEFLKGEIEHIPLQDSSVDVIISNCVINLSADKDQVLAEAFRVLKPNGRFAVADIVLTKHVSDTVKKHVGLWTGCVAGALEIEEYKLKLLQAGFASPAVEIAKTYSTEDSTGLIPEEVIAELGKDGMDELMGSFVSAFIKATKPKGCCCGC
jgi:SAM-dependent methyltransferase